MIVDNCEHLIEPASAVVESILAACPQGVIMTTSRAPLDLAGEARWPTPPMSLPTSAARDPADALRHSDALRLFFDAPATSVPISRSR